MGSPRFLTDPQWNQLLDANERRRNLAARYRAEIDADPALPLRVLEHSRAYPGLDPSIVAGLAVEGVPVDHPSISAIAIRNAQMAEATEAQAHGDESVLGRLGSFLGGGVDLLHRGAKFTTRTAMAAWDLLRVEGIERPIRAAVLAYQPNEFSGAFGFFDALRSPQSGESYGKVAFNTAVRGERVNLGEGWLPSSDLAPEVQEAVSQGLPLNVALEAHRAAQDPIGKPLTQIAHEQAERTQFVHRGMNSGVSLGRFAAVGADWLTPGYSIAPETAAWDVVSGGVDLGSQLVLDPAYKFTKPLSLARKANKTFESARGAAGVFGDTARPALLRRDAQRWLTSRPGRNATQRLARETDSQTIWNMLRGAADRPIPPEIVRELRDADTPQKVHDIFGRILGTEIKRAPVPTSLLSRATGERVPTVAELVARARNPQLEGIGGVRAAFRGQEKNGYWRRLATDRPDRHVSVVDPGRGMVELDRAMVGMGLSAEQRAPYIDRWVELTRGDVATGQRIVDDVLNEWVDVMAAKGLDKATARRVVQRHKYDPKDRLYAINGVGDAERAPYLTRNVTVDGKPIPLPAPSKLAELSDLGVHLPDPEKVWRATRSQEGLGRITTRITSNASKDFTERALVKLATKASFAWKVSVLARLAYPIRVVGEEQVRMAAAGLDSMFTHPLQYAAFFIGKGGKKLDVLGDDIAMAAAHKQAMSSADGWLGRGTAGTQNYRRVTKGQPTYFKDWYSSDLNHHFSDPVVRRVMRRDYAGESWDEVVDWLISGEGRVHLDDMLQARPDWLNSATRQVERSVVEDWARSLEASAHRVTGGSYRRLDVKGGVWHHSDGTAHAATADEVASGVKWEIVDPGDDTLLSGIAEGKLFGVDVTSPVGMNDASYQTVIRGLEDHVVAGGKAPAATKGAIEPDKGMWDSMTPKLFDFLIGHPTDKLSRSPAFSQFYWQRMAELMPYMDAKTAEAATAAAVRAGIGQKSWRGMVKDRLAVHPDPDVQAELRAARKALGDKADIHPEKLRGRLKEADATVVSLQDADDIAKSVALQEVQDLLYDATRRRNVSWITQNVFPFGEAWAEIYGVWGKLLYENPEVLRRFQQGMEGMRGEGWFYENENGEEMFAIPGGGFLASALFSSGGVPLSIKPEARVSGLNLAAGSFLPGVGPLVQIPAAYFLPDHPDWDWVRGFVLPFGPNSMESESDLADMLIPPWAKKALAFMGLKGGDSERLFNNTVIDVARFLELTGEYDLTSPDDMRRLLDDAKGKARVLYGVRALTQFWAPSAPQFELEAQDKNGEWFRVQTLASEYHALKDRMSGDDVAAARAFTDRFGFEPYGFAAGKSAQIAPRALEAKSLEWQRRNADLFDRYSGTAHYLMPDDQAEFEFDYPAYLRQLREGTRQPVTPEQWQQARNDLAASMIYENTRRQLGEQATTQEGQLFLRTVRDQLIEDYPGYKQTIVGLPAKAKREERIAELESWLTDEDPRLRETEGGQAIQLYMRSRRKMVASATSALGITEGGFATSTRAAPFRETLRQYGENLVGQYPAFQSVWSAILLSELRGDEEREPVPTELLGQSFTADDLIPAAG